MGTCAPQLHLFSWAVATAGAEFGRGTSVRLIKCRTPPGGWQMELSARNGQSKAAAQVHAIAAAKLPSTVYSSDGVPSDSRRRAVQLISDGVASDE